MEIEHNFESIFKNHITNFILEKRRMGYKYKENEHILYRFDRYCVENKINSLGLTKDDLSGWITQKDSEELRTLQSRVSIVRVFLLYMCSLGFNEYLPHIEGSPPLILPHILTSDEICAFFSELDSYKIDANLRRFVRFENEYKVIFRLIYLCGLRISEACNLRLNDYNYDKSIITIRGAKNGIDRLVYLSADLNRQLYLYVSNVLYTIQKDQEMIWMFPGRDICKNVTRKSLEKTFNNVWERTEFSKMCSNPPTVHDLRHTFITNTINKWVKNGANLDEMMPYLMKYVGHKSLQSTHYYYHMAQEAREIILAHDKKVKKLKRDVKKYDWE